MYSDEEILRLINERVDHPATVKELLQALKVPRDERASFKRGLKSLVGSGGLVEIRGGRFGLPDRMNLVVGRVSTNPRGFAFVEPETPQDDLPSSLYIAGNNLNQAVHGDRVVVRVERRRDGDRAEGRILRILERGSERIVGRFELDEAGHGFVVPFDRRLIMDVQVPRAERRGAEAGEMVTVTITRWPTATRPALGRITEVLGPLEAPGVDTKVIIRKYNLPEQHTDEAVAEATRLGGAIKEKDAQGRTDFREWQTVTIDGEHARDFDDCDLERSAAPMELWWAVHIADVAHYVTRARRSNRGLRAQHVSVLSGAGRCTCFRRNCEGSAAQPARRWLVQSCMMEVDRRNGAVVRYEMH